MDNSLEWREKKDILRIYAYPESTPFTSLLMPTTFFSGSRLSARGGYRRQRDQKIRVTESRASEARGGEWGHAHTKADVPEVVVPAVRAAPVAGRATQRRGVVIIRPASHYPAVIRTIHIFLETISNRVLACQFHLHHLTS